MFYEIKVTIWAGNISHSTRITSLHKRKKIFFKNDLIKEAKRITDSKIINYLNSYYDDCQFDFIKAYHKYKITFWGKAEIRNRMTDKSDLVYDVEWEKDHWNLELDTYLADKLTLK